MPVVQASGPHCFFACAKLRPVFFGCDRFERIVPVIREDPS
jgi:hypothetical protein